MRFTVDRMTMADIPRVTEIERLAYPSPWPPSAYRKELQENRYAHYVVVRDSQLAQRAAAERQEAVRRTFPLSLFPSRQQQSVPPEQSSIVGFAGLWLMLDESHVTTIATHPDYRGRGIGELLLSSLIDVSLDIGARMVTLEVRVSNYVAQSLYRKYGFHDAGTRRRYYSDNHEDALIMWTDDISSPDFKAQLAELKRALAVKLEDENADDLSPRRERASGPGQSRQDS